MIRDISIILRMCVGLTPPPPPPKTLPSDQIVISYVKLFLNNETKPQMNGLVRKQIFWGGVNPTQIRSTCSSHGQVVCDDDGTAKRLFCYRHYVAIVFFLVCFLLLGRCEGRPSSERETPGRPSFCLSHPPLLWRHLTSLPIAPRARTGGRHSPLGRSLPRASGRGPLTYIKFYCSSSARAACWKRRQALAWSETTFILTILRTGSMHF